MNYYKNAGDRQKIWWNTVNEYVDTDTGEIINPYGFKKQYQVIKKIKEYETNKNKTKGTIRITNICRRINTQGRLFE